MMGMPEVDIDRRKAFFKNAQLFDDAATIDAGVSARRIGALRQTLFQRRRVAQNLHTFDLPDLLIFKRFTKPALR